MNANKAADKLTFPEFLLYMYGFGLIIYFCNIPQGHWFIRKSAWLTFRV